MIIASIRIEGDDADWFDGKCELPALPPLGGSIRIIDRYGNMRDLHVRDIVMQAVSLNLDKQSPISARPLDGGPLYIHLICEESLGPPDGFRAGEKPE